MNGHLYEVCPKFISLMDPDSRLILELYMDCRESRTLPASGNWLDQTAFARDVFNFLDGEVTAWRAAKQKKKSEGTDG